MVNKRGAEMSLNFIIIAAIVLVVLIVAVLFFTGSTGKLLKKQAETAGLSTEEYGLALSMCRLACTTQNQGTYDEPKFTESVLKKYTKCSALPELGDFADECLGKCEVKDATVTKNCGAHTSKQECGDDTDCLWKAGSIAAESA